MKHYKVVLVLLAIALFSSCREEDPAVLNPEDDSRFTSWDDVFESFWNGMNYSYAFWDVDPTDWDAMYKECKPRFQNLEFYNSQDSIDAIGLFKKMTENLIDHHYSLAFKNKKGEIWGSTSPGYKEVVKRKYYHEPFTEEELMNTIEANGNKGRIEYYSYAFSVNDRHESLHIYSYNIDNGIAYLRLSEFNLRQNLNSPYVQRTLTNFYELVESLPTLRGIVIDTRGNRGGYLADMCNVLSPLTSQEVTFGYTRTKNGMGRLDYTPWSPMILYPASNSTDDRIAQNQIKRNIENIPIVALADINSVSMGEMTPMAICALPNGCLIGERTFGAHGPLNGNLTDSYAGSFENEIFLVNTSTSLTKNLDGNIYEGIGLTPDIEALYNEAEFLNGNDTQLERAIQYINTGK